MIGAGCIGQAVKDYVTRAYLRDDHILDEVLPPDIPYSSVKCNVRFKRWLVGSRPGRDQTATAYRYMVTTVWN